MGLSCKKNYGKVQSIFRKLDNEILNNQVQAKKSNSNKTEKKSDKK